MRLELEEVEGTLVGRIFIRETKTSAYLIPLDENKHLFTKEQLELIDKQLF